MEMKRTPAEILREYGPYPEVEGVHGVGFDGQRIWFASGDRLNGLDPDSGRILQTLAVPADAGTAFDGKHLFQIAEAVIRKIDPETGVVLGTIRSEEHTSELQSLMRISYAAFCLKKTNQHKQQT